MTLLGATCNRYADLQEAEYVAMPEKVDDIDPTKYKGFCEILPAKALHCFFSVSVVQEMMHAIYTYLAANLEERRIVRGSVRLQLLLDRYAIKPVMMGLREHGE